MNPQTQTDKKQIPKRTVVVTVSDGPARDGFLNTLESADRAKKDAAVADLAALKESLKPLQAEAAQALTEVAELSKLHTKFLDRILAMNLGSMALQYSIPAPLTNLLHSRAESLRDYIADAQSKLTTLAQGHIPEEDGRSHEPRASDLEERWYGTNVHGVVPGRHPMGRARFQHQLAIYRYAPTRIREGIEEINYLLGEVEVRVKKRAGAPPPTTVRISDIDVEHELHGDPNRSRRPGEPVGPAVKDFEL